MPKTTSTASEDARQPSLGGHLAICRFDHWFKNVFVLPGIIAALAMDESTRNWSVLSNALIGLFAIGLVASSNYTINEILDAANDREHPEKRHRPVPSGRVSLPLGYLQWILLFLLGLAVGALVSWPFTLTLAALWIMGCIYNIPPLRSKELPFLDVLSESINNPIRMLAGWFIAGSTLIAPTSLLLSYWMFGCFFMALKRYAEYRSIADPERAARYRRSFVYYNEGRLLSSVVVYACAACLLFGAFLMRYQLELVLAFPFIAWVAGEYFNLGLMDDSPVQAPEHLYRQSRLMLAVTTCTLVIGALLFIELPILHSLFRQSVAH